MSIANALSNALSGLTASSRMAEITSDNLANALTDSYARRTVELAAASAGGAGAGVKITGVSRASSPELTSARRVADGELAEELAGLDALRALERAIGMAGDSDGLAARVNAFEETLRQLAETPELAARQTAAAEAARDLALRINSISTETARVRQTADDEIARQVAEVNSALARIARLNRQIQIYASSGRDIAGLVDERERLIDQVAAIVPIRERQRADGVVELTTAEGLMLTGVRARQISFTPTPVITPAMRYDGGAGALGGLTLDGVDITPGGPGTQAIRGGALAAQFMIRDQLAPEVSDRIDALAADLMARFEAPGLDPTATAGAAGLFTDAGQPLDPTDIRGLAGRLTLNAAVDPQQGGDPARLRDGLYATAPGPASDPTLPRAMLDALTARVMAVAIPGLPANLSFSGAVTQMSELQASARVAKEGEVAAIRAGRETLATAEAETIGVDTDAELQSLIRIEQAYAANAKVIETVSRLLDRLMEI